LSRDRQLSLSAQQMLSLEAQLEQTTENISQLQLKLDSCRQKYDSSTQHSASLESEIVQLREQLSYSQQQVINMYINFQFY